MATGAAVVNGTAVDVPANKDLASNRPKKKTAMSLHDDRDLEGQIREQALKKATWGTTFALAYRCLGVIYGDVGTSPLYVYASTFVAPPSQDDVVGLASLIFWTITLVIVFKYMLIVLTADDHGEGGTFALYSLIARHAHIATPATGTPNSSDMVLSRYTSNQMIEGAQKRKPANLGERVALTLRGSKVLKSLLLGVVLLATSMILGDGVLTPAISVIGAVVGIQVAAPSITTGAIVGITCAILIVLFCFQRFGTSKVGFTFAPIVLTWYAANVMINLYNIIIYYPAIFKALSPHYLFLFFIRNGFQGWFYLGGTLLCITGTEAIYADMGHFSKTAIRMSFLLIAYPALVITYLGQAAYLMINPDNYSTVFYSCIPTPVYWPMFVIAVLAAIVASQAMISGAFSIVKQSIALGCFPRVKVVHTSGTVEGQIYVPFINWMLMVLTVAVVAGFQNSTVIGNAYGVAVTFVMFITTNLMLLAAFVVYNINPLISLPIWALFLLIDGSYLSANLFKFLNGGWFPIALAFVVFVVSSIWFYGRDQKTAYAKKNALYLEQVISPNGPTPNGEEEDDDKALGGSKKPLLLASGEKLLRVPGCGLIFGDTVSTVPPVFVHMVNNLNAVYETVVLVTVRSVPVTKVLPEERFLFRPLTNAPGFYRAVARFGYRDRVDLNLDFANQLKKELIASITPIGASAPKDKTKKITYVMGNTTCEAREGSPFWRRILVESLYNPLALLTRARNQAWNVPRRNLIEFGIVFDI
jgi:KUP system potassium uptake protein